MTVLGGDSDRARIAATALLTLPGTPFVYYGEEIGMSGDKPDERLRTPMQWTGNATGGFTSGTPWEVPQADVATVNVASQEGNPASLLELYRQLIHLRNAQPALARGDLSLVDTGNPDVTAFLRQTDDAAVLVILNVGTSAVERPKFTAYASCLPVGTYGLTPLRSPAPAADLDVARGGTFGNYSPLPTLDPQTGYIFALERLP